MVNKILWDLQFYSSTLSAAYDFISNNCSILLPVHVTIVHVIMINNGS